MPVKYKQEYFIQSQRADEAELLLTPVYTNQAWALSSTSPELTVNIFSLSPQKQVSSGQSWTRLEGHGMFPLLNFTTKILKSNKKDRAIIQSFSSVAQIGFTRLISTNTPKSWAIKVKLPLSTPALSSVLPQGYKGGGRRLLPSELILRRL